MPLRSIKKRDGRLVPFDEHKIQAAIEKAMAAQGEADGGFAAEVALVVRLTLEARFGQGGLGEVPGIEEIQDLVERALIELGRSNVAKAYILYRDRRRQAREALASEGRAGRGTREQPASGALARPTGGAPLVHDRHASLPWDKSRIVAALIREAQLARESAERVASLVEERVVQARFRRISTGLVRELVDNELVGLGLEHALHKQTSYGVPSADLKRMFSAPPPALLAQEEGDPARELERSRGLAERISALVCQRFALQEVLSGASLERHLSGDFHIEGLEQPQRWLCACVPLDLLADEEWSAPDAFAAHAGVAQGTSSRAFEALLGAAELAATAASHVVLEAPLGALPGLGERRARSERLDQAERARELEHWLDALCALSRAQSARLDLCVSVPRPRGQAVEVDALWRGELLLAGLVRCARESGRSARAQDGSLGARAPRLSLELDRVLAWAGSDLHHPDGLLQRGARGALERLLADGRLAVRWPRLDGGTRAGFEQVGPGCRRAPRERGALALGGSVALNLPRLALAAGPWREERFLEALGGAVEDAIEALGALAHFQLRAQAARATSLRPRVVYQVVPLGLREALQILGDGEIRPEQAVRALSRISERLERQAERGGPDLALGEWSSTRALARLAELDRALPQHAQRLLFSDGAGHGLEPGRPYSAGLRLSPAPGWEPFEAEAELCARAPLCGLESLTLCGRDVWTLAALEKLGAALELRRAELEHFAARAKPTATPTWPEWCEPNAAAEHFASGANPLGGTGGMGETGTTKPRARPALESRAHDQQALER